MDKAAAIEFIKGQLEGGTPKDVILSEVIEKTGKSITTAKNYLKEAEAGDEPEQAEPAKVGDPYDDYKPKASDKDSVHLLAEVVAFSATEMEGTGMNATPKRLSKPYVLKVSTEQYEQSKGNYAAIGVTIHKVLYTPK